MKREQQTLEERGIESSTPESARDEKRAANTGRKSEPGVQGMKREQQTLVGRVNRECKG